MTMDPMILRLFSSGLMDGKPVEFKALKSKSLSVPGSGRSSGASILLELCTRLKCACKLPIFLKVQLHNSHLISGSSVSMLCTRLMCDRRFPACVKAIWQKSHLYGFSPVCFRRCKSRVFFWLNAFLQCSHWNRRGKMMWNVMRFLTDAVIHDKNVFLVSVPTKSLDLVESSEGILLILDFIVSNNAYFRTIAASKSPLCVSKKKFI